MTMPRLLIIDDEVNLARTLSMFFRSRGYETITAGNVTEGVESFEEHRPSFVICDVL